jgi:anti-anti-sigma factor
MFDLTMTHVHDGALHFQATGRLTQSTMLANESFDESLNEELFNQNIVIDLGGVELIDSTGIGWLLTNNRKFKEKGGKLVLHSLQPNVKNVFGMMKLGQVLTLATDKDAANATLENSGVDHE